MAPIDVASNVYQASARDVIGTRLIPVLLSKTASYYVLWHDKVRETTQTLSKT